MSSFNVAEYFQLLRQQVTSLLQLNLNTVLNWMVKTSTSGIVVYRKSLLHFVLNFFEYFNNDGMVTSIPPEIQANETFRISVLNILDTATETTILTSSVLYCFGTIYIDQNIQLILPELSIAEGARSRQRTCCKIKKIR